MKTIATFGGLTPSFLGDSVYNELVSIYPESKGNYSFTAPYDEHIQELFKFLQRNGFEPATGFPPVRSNQFSMLLNRVYDAADFMGCLFLVPRPVKTLEIGAQRSEKGLLQLLRSETIPILDFSSDPAGHLIISEQARPLLEKEDFQHLHLKPIHIIEDIKSDNSSILSQYWELASDIIMPPLSKKMQIVNRDGLPVDVGTSKDYFIREGLTIPEVLFLPAELHYAENTIQEIGVFDLALTYEQPYKKRGLPRGWIASKHFYEYCTAQSFKVEWQPVRIDD